MWTRDRLPSRVREGKGLALLASSGLGVLFRCWHLCSSGLEGLLNLGGRVGLVMVSLD